MRHPSELVEFWKLAARLKREPRRGWIQRIGLNEVESVADHSFALAILSLLEGEKRGYNLEKLLKMALIHDLEEAITGDLTPCDRSRMTTRVVSRRREAAVESVLRRIPLETREGYRRLLADLRMKGSKEARLVKDLDQLEMALQANEYQRTGVDRRDLADFYDSAMKRMKDMNLRKTLRGVVGSRN